MTNHQRIILNGDGYSEEWVIEANRRGLPNLTCMIDAVDTLTTEKAVSLFEKFGIFTRAELESREEILYEIYAKTINIEALTMIDIASKQIIPSVIRYTKELADTVAVMQQINVEANVQRELLIQVSQLLNTTKLALEELKEVEGKANHLAEGKEQAYFYKEKVVRAMNALRTPVDEMEKLVDKSIWPLPSYADLLFEV